jgi:hypothetical protein
MGKGLSNVTIALASPQAQLFVQREELLFVLSDVVFERHKQSRILGNWKSPGHFLTT